MHKNSKQYELEFGRIKRNFKTFEIPIFLLNPGPEIYKPGDNINIIPKNKIEEKDLYFTLTKNPLQYPRPVVELDHYGPTVKGNNTIFEIGKDAGLASLLCDVKLSTLEDKHFSQLNLFEPNIILSDYSHLLIFLDQKDKFPTSEELEQKLEKYNTIFKNTTINTYPEETGIEVKQHKKNKNYTAALYSLLKNYGSIRSINGIKP